MDVQLPGYIYQGDNDSYELVWNKKRRFFHGKCHNCFKTRADGYTNFKFCSGCQLVEYCSEECLRNGELSHNDICQTMKTFLPNLSSPKFNCDDWITYKRTLMKEIRNELKNLSIDEEDMLNFPKDCAFCHVVKPDQRVPCTKCFQVYYCSHDHMNKFSHKSEDCDLYALILQCDVEEIGSTGILLVHIPEVRETEYRLLQSSMEELISSMPEQRTRVQNAFTSEVLSYPLTIQYAMEYLYKNDFPDTQLHMNSLSKFQVHVIGNRSLLYFQSYRLWDYLARKFPSMESLILTFIGLSDVYEENSQFCSKVLINENNNRTNLVLEYIDIPYDEWMEQKSYAKPNLIVIFNGGLSPDQKDWTPVLDGIFNDTDCPVVLTSSTLNEAMIDFNIIIDERNCNLLLSPAKNDFSSLRPHRNRYLHPEEPFAYDNAYIAIFRKNTSMDSSEFACAISEE